MNIDMCTRFEDLLVWQRARAFCGAVLPVVRTARAAHDFELSQELNGSSISIMSNIAEGHTRRRCRQFAYFLDIAGGSNGEARSCLYLGLDRQYVTPSHFESLKRDSEEIARMLDSLAGTVRRQNDSDFDS
jgi:four helix bundle protein